MFYLEVRPVRELGLSLKKFKQEVEQFEYLGKSTGYNRRRIEKIRAMKSINILKIFDLFSEYWTPKIIGELNGQHVKLAKLVDEFVWHSHEEEDELFMVFKGTLIMEFRDRIEIIREGEMLIVPKGVEHFPRTENGEEVWVLLFEPAETRHTGEVEHEKTVNDQKWL